MKRISAALLTTAALAGSAVAIVPATADAHARSHVSSSCVVIPLWGPFQITLCV